MSIDFRCENCGKLLSVQDVAGSTRCTHCGKKVSIPEAVASLPRPLVAPNAAAANGSSSADTATAVADQPRTDAQSDQATVDSPAPESEVMTAMGKAMPWIISVFLHLGLGMILGFAAMIGTAMAGSNQDAESDLIVPDAAWSDEPGGVLNPSQVASNDNSRSSSVARSEYAKADMVADSGLTAKHAAINVAGGLGASVGSGTGKGDILGLGLGGGGGGGGGPKTSLFGKGGNAHHVVYVIDKSGSMVDSFDYVRREMLNSIAKLKPVQDFHVIFFSSGKVTLENPPQQLVPATPEYRKQAAEFLDSVRPEGSTDPIPAMERAFQALAKCDQKKKGKLLYILTDAVNFDNKRFLDMLAVQNKQKEVHIITFLYGSSSKGSVDLMKKVAEENGGSFKQISSEE